MRYDVFCFLILRLPDACLGRKGGEEGVDVFVCVLVEVVLGTGGRLDIGWVFSVVVSLWEV